MLQEKEMDLVVLDDEPEVTEMLGVVLAASCCVRATNTLRDACCELCRRPPDCVLCDYHIGPRTSRIFLLAIAELFPQTRRVLMSGAPLDELQPLLDEGVVQAIVTKPFELDRLLTSLRAGSEGPNERSKP